MRIELLAHWALGPPTLIISLTFPTPFYDNSEMSAAFSVSRVGFERGLVADGPGNSPAGLIRGFFGDPAMIIVPGGFSNFT